MIEKYFLANEMIIDLGCGLGTQLKHLPPEAKKCWVGLDSRLDLLQTIRVNYSDIHLIQGDLYNLPIKTGEI